LITVSSDLEFLVISVKDTGIGISSENQKKLFKLFGFIEETSSKNTNGIGLGLMITRKLVEQFSGKIWVDSHIEIGSTFTFKLKTYVEMDQ
jgi:signal transduction histidine kinase